MDAFTTNDLNRLLEPRELPRMSIYMPTECDFGAKNAVRWKNQLHAAERTLTEADIDESVYRQWLAPAWRLQGEREFWRHQSDGFAWFLSGGFNRFYRLPIPFEESVTCGANFRLTPVLEALGENGGFYVLSISQKRLRLLHGTRFGLEEIALTTLPASLAEALRFDRKAELRDFHGMRPGPNAAWSSLFDEQGDGFDEHKTDLLRYFQRIDSGLNELLRNERAPLILAGSEYLWPIYQQANTYAHLQKTGIAGNPDQVPDTKLHEQAWKLVAPLFRQPRQNALSNYALIVGTGHTTESLEEVLRAAHQGMVDTLFLDRDAEWYGTFDPLTSRLTLCNSIPSTEEELLNVAALCTLRHGGKVWMCTTREMRRSVVIAAVLRMPLALRLPQIA